MAQGGERRTAGVRSGDRIGLPYLRHRRQRTTTPHATDAAAQLVQGTTAAHHRTKHPRCQRDRPAQDNSAAQDTSATARTRPVHPPPPRQCTAGRGGQGRQGKAGQGTTGQPPEAPTPSGILQPAGYPATSPFAFQHKNPEQRSRRSTSPSLWFLDATVPVTAHGANISQRERFQTGRNRLRGAENLHNMHTDLRLCAFLAGSGRFEISWREKRWLLRQSRAPSRPKTKRMAKLSGLTVALHVLHGTRWSSCSLRACFPDRVLPAGGPRRAAVARSAHHAAAPERKGCRSGRVVKPIADYAVDRSRRTGFAGICKACDCGRASARYHRNTPGAVSQQERERRRTVQRAATT